MSRIAYVNGRYLPHQAAAVHIEDRGFQFADGVYEVCEVLGGRLVDFTRHAERLDRSLSELRIESPLSREALRLVLQETVRRNRVVDGSVYFQVTRGASPRDFPFPGDDVNPTLVVTARLRNRAASDRQAEQGVAVVSYPDMRWRRRDIKTVGLLPQVLAKQHARENGGFEAWLVDDQGHVTEGASSNAWIITADRKIVSRKPDYSILRGITRTTLLDVLAKEGLTFEERAFTLDEAKKAQEAFMSSATTIVMPIVRIDGAPVGDGKPGPMARRLRSIFHDTAEIVAA